MNQYIPEVKFDLTPIDLEANMLYVFSGPSDRFSNVMHKVYPELQDILTKSNDKTEAIENYKLFIKETVEKHNSELVIAKEMIEKDWEKVGNSYLHVLSKHMETDWPEDNKLITGYISINPICPRFLANYSFFVDYRKSLEQARETIAHEILHFLWFKKWKEVFDDSKSSDYESPHLVWRLSEVMDPIILQCNAEIKDLIKPTRWGYDSFRDLKIGDIGMTQHFAQLYMKQVNLRKPFDEILQILWVEAQNQKEILSKF